MVFRSLIVTVLVLIASHSAVGAPLSALVGGQSLSAGGVTFSNWRLEQNLGSVSPALDQIDVTAQQTDGRHVALSLTGNGLTAAAADDLIFSLGIDITAPVGLSGLAAQLNQPTASGDGLVDSVISLADTSGIQVAQVGVVLDPSFGVSQLTGATEFSPRQALGASTSLSVFGPGSVGGLTQTFTLVPEPSSVALVLTGGLLFGAMIGYRRVRPLALVVMLLAGAATVSQAADHRDSPGVESDGRLDVNDVYAFQSPNNGANVVFAVTTNPLAGVLSPTTYHPTARYELHVDTNGDALTDVLFEFTFGAPGAGGTQPISMRQNGALTARGLTGSNIRLRSNGGGRLRAGVFDDPFFFDLNGFRNNLQFTGDDFFEGVNTCAIVLEIPRALLGADNVGVWARTLVNDEQFDRKGRPAINTALITTGNKDAFNGGVPANDRANFGAIVNSRILALSGSQEHADMLTPVILPDILTIDTSNPGGFLNGRRLQDDVIDAELTLLTNSSTPVGDGVDSNDRPFLTVFPYLATPNR